MKRKLLALALVLSMTFALFGCRQGGDVRKDVQDGEEKLISVEECHLVLRLTVDHKLELYLDEAGTVLKAAAGDKGGEKMLSALELTGLSYGDAVSAILSYAEVAENANVHIDVLASADGPLTQEQTRQLEQAVIDYDGLLVPSVDQSVVIAASCGADSVKVEKLANGDIFYDYYSDGVGIRQVCYGADGSYSEWAYQDMLTTDAITISPDGKRNEEHYTYENGVQTSHVQILQEGDRFLSEEQRYENGVLTSWVQILQEGDRFSSEERRYENGQISYSCMKNSEGYFAESTYYSDANPKTVEEHCPNGENYIYLYTSYEEDGSCHTVQKAKDGTILEYVRDGNGCYKEEFYQFPDGSTQRREFSADGIEVYCRCMYANGDWMERTNYPNGRIKTEEGSVGGEEYSIHYDENGEEIVDD